MSGSGAQDCAVDAPAADTRAHGDPVLSARMRASPEDFFVEELAGFEPSGSGEHLLLTVEKRGMNTAFAARGIAQWAGVDEMAIGYAGLKDRHAVTRQRFSVHLPRRIAPDIAALQVDGLQVLEQAWHTKKLPRGALAGNRFVLVLREVVADASAIETRLQQIADRGVPNFFGEQRFGRDGNNLGKALAMFEGRRVRRDERGMLLSAARSVLFNQVLQARVEAHCWDASLTGEVWMLDGSRSVFGPEPVSPEIEQRLAAFDIHPSGPLWGRGELRSSADALALEQAALADPVSMRLRAGLEQAGLRQERRSLRLRAGALAWQWRDPSTLQLSFSLPPGTYATVVLAELGTVRDAARPAEP